MKNMDVWNLIEKAKKSASAAKKLLESGYSDFSVSRSYYAMFYATEALLLAKNLSYSKHSAVISEFGKKFVKTGIIPSKLHRYITDAFDARQIGDYSPIDIISEEKALMMTEHAEEFIHIIEEYLKKKEEL